MTSEGVCSCDERTGDEAVNRIGREETASVFTTCACVPEEILTAAGLHARRLLPGSAPADADSHVHPGTCGYVKSLLASGLAGEEPRASCIVIGNSCDGMRKLYDLWDHSTGGESCAFSRKTGSHGQ